MESKLKSYVIIFVVIGSLFIIGILFFNPESIGELFAYALIIGAIILALNYVFKTLKKD
jgi:hypothetical protein